MIPFLTVFDPDEEIKNTVRIHFIASAPDLQFGQASAYIVATLQRLGPRELRRESIFRGLTLGHVIGLRLQQFEMAFPRLLHLLAHHPDFARTHESAVGMSKFAKFVPGTFQC